VAISPDTTIAFLAFALTILTLMSSIVWLLATMRTSLRVLIRDQSATNEILAAHTAECDKDRVAFKLQLKHLEAT
jgi:hypothetical protein